MKGKWLPLTNETAVTDMEDEQKPFISDASSIQTPQPVKKAPSDRKATLIYFSIMGTCLIGGVTLIVLSFVMPWTYENNVQIIVVWQQKGITFTNGKYCPNIRYNDSRAELSLKNLASTGANYVSIVVTQFQQDINSTEIEPTKVTATDDELAFVINKAHSLGLKVMLKPHVDLAEDPDHWRGNIGEYFTSEEWNEWFDSYTTMIVHYATLSQKYNVTLFSIGCELIATSKQAEHWTNVVGQVRKAFKGNITYAANWGGEETNLTWWNLVDYIGVDAYYPIAPDVENPTVRQMVDYWTMIVQKGVDNGINGHMHGGLENLTTTYKKDMIFTEIGYCSGNCPLGYNADTAIQQSHYEAVFRAFQSYSWFKGVYWWNWATDPAFGGKYNVCSTPQFKPAEDTLRTMYGGKRQSEQPKYPPVCPCIL